MTHPNTTLESLAERGSPRGATAVLSGARQAAVRHRRRRAMAGSTALAVVLTGAVGATVYLSPDDEIRPLGGGSGAPPPTGGPQTLTGITVEGHDGFDRIVLQFNVDEVDIRENTEYSGFAPGAECEDFERLARVSGSELTILSARGSGDDGLAPGLADTPIAGDTTYISDVTALCNVDGYAWLAIADKPPVQGGVIRGPDFDAENPRMVSHPWCPGGAPGQVYIDTYEVDRRPPGTCPPAGE